MAKEDKKTKTEKKDVTMDQNSVGAKMAAENDEMIEQTGEYNQMQHEFNERANPIQPISSNSIETETEEETRGQAALDQQVGRYIV